MSDARDGDSGLWSVSVPEIRSDFARRLGAWTAVDWAVGSYTLFVAVLAVVRAHAVPEWPVILASHSALLVALLLLPPRGAAWEQPRPEQPTWVNAVRAVARFLRYTYPALLLTPFFEEVWWTVNAIAPSTPYWFEHHLMASDRALFGGIPAVTLARWGGPVLDEVMHAFYLSYYPLVTAGIILAWRGRSPCRGTPAPGFDLAMTTMMLGFLLSFVWYPFLPARGPWEHPDIVDGLRPFGGWLFTGAINLIISGAAVSGGCFPSAHVSGTWALVFGLYPTHRKAALWLAAAATGLSLACVYTRYHYGTDVLGGIAVAVVAAAIGRRLTRR